MTIPDSPRRTSLSTQVALYLALAVALAFGLLGWLEATEETARAEAALKAGAKDRAVIVALSVAPLLAGGDYATVETVANAVARQAGVTGFRVVNTRGITVITAAAGGPSKVQPISVSQPVVFNGQDVGIVHLDVSSDVLATRKREILADTAMIVAVSSILLWLALHLLLTWKVLTPLRHLREMVMLIACRPESISRDDLPCSSQDEVGELVLVFNDMKRKLGNTYDKLEDKVNLADTALRQANATLQERATQLEKAFTTVEGLSITDSLTGVLNRRGFEEILQRGFAEAKRYDQPASLMLVDLDYFKTVNDQYGHNIGDKVLIAVAGALRDGIRDCDSVGRLGGDEFVVFLPNTDPEEAEIMCERVQCLAKALRVSHESIEITVSLTYGLATSGADVPTPERLIGNADLALYEAKRRGRDRWCAFVQTAAPEDYRGERSHV